MTRGAIGRYAVVGSLTAVLYFGPLVHLVEITGASFRVAVAFNYDSHRR